MTEPVGDARVEFLQHDAGHRRHIELLGVRQRHPHQLDELGVGAGDALHAMGDSVGVEREEARIEPVLRDYARFFKENYKGKFQLVVVLNGCKDNTLGVVQRTSRDFFSVSYLDFPEAIGKGGALIEGLKLAPFADLIGYVDADGATPPQAFLDLVKRIGQADCVIGSRWLPGAVIHQSQTGNRRFWPLALRAPIDIDKLKRDRLQLWGEAAWLESRGESITLDDAGVIGIVLIKLAILAVYMNHIYLGAGAWGVAAAARRYFQKDLDQLTLAECALIAGLAKAPTAYSPIRSIKLAWCPAARTSSSASR